MPVLPLFVIGPLASSADDLELSLEVLTSPGKAHESGKKPELLPLRRQRFEDRTTIAFARGLSELVGGFVAPPDYAD